MDTLQAIILGLVQGLTEFLPISSSAHLGLISYIFQWEEQLQLDIILHVASLIALIAYFRKDLKTILISLFDRNNPNNRKDSTELITNILISLLPLIPIYILLKDFIEPIQQFSQITMFLLIFFGAFLILADKKGRGNIKKISDITKFQALFIGIAQGIALFSGVSRSGITITIGLLLGLREDAAKKFTFLLSIPTIMGGFALEAIDIIQGDMLISFDINLLLAIISAIISAYLALKLLFQYGSKIKLTFYGIYRIILGVIILIAFF